MIPINELVRGFHLYQSEYEEKALEVLRSGWYVLGHQVEAFENEFAQALGSNCYCAGVDNGLDAIWLGLKAAGIMDGDEILVQANGYIATMLGVMQCGIWRCMINFTPDCILMAVCDRPYDPDDETYDDYEEYLRALRREEDAPLG